MVIGMDEAGRGPVIGPMTVAAYWTDDEAALSRIGVRDSKLLSPLQRERVNSFLIEKGAWSLLSVPAASIDEARGSITMNQLEVLCFASTAASVLKGEVLLARGIPEGCLMRVRGKAGLTSQIKVDAADVNEERFGEDIAIALKRLLPTMDLTVSSRHKADRDHPVVGAASIMAKVERDRTISMISRELGRDVGSGYPSDPVTIGFLREWVKERNGLPPHCRRSWETARRILSGRSQNVLDLS